MHPAMITAAVPGGQIPAQAAQDRPALCPAALRARPHPGWSDDLPQIRGQTPTLIMLPSPGNPQVAGSPCLSFVVTVTQGRWGRLVSCR